MPLPVDLATLRLCSILASITFVVIFLALWRGRKDRAYNVHWAASLLLYCVALAGLEWINRPQDVLVRSLLVATLAASNIPLSTGVRLFAADPLWRWWMAVPPAATLLGFLLPHLAARLGMALPLGNSQMLAAPGLALGMAVFGADMVRQAGRAVPQGYGGRIAGAALLAYIPCYIFAIASELVHLATPATLAFVALLSDQLLLMLLNVGLLAMPAEAALVAMREASWRDGLTGLHNRAWFSAAMRDLLRPGTWVAHIDIDHFKTINDRFGHAAGDQTLVHLAGALVHVTRDRRPAVELVRMGGDEFLAIVPQASSFAAQKLMQDVRFAVGEHAVFPFSISIGLAEVAADDLSLGQVVDRADRQLYIAKRAGRDRVAA